MAEVRDIEHHRASNMFELHAMARHRGAGARPWRPCPCGRGLCFAMVRGSRGRRCEAGDDPEWRGVGAPDCLFVPPGTLGSEERLLLERTCVIGYILSADGRSTSVDSTAPTVQLLIGMHLLSLLRRGRAVDAQDCRGAAGVPLPLQAPLALLAVGLPRDWQQRRLGCLVRDARVWRTTWAPDVATGTLLAVERSHKLTVAEAAALVLSHLGA